jgi:hypothetical protein
VGNLIHKDEVLDQIISQGRMFTDWLEMILILRGVFMRKLEGTSYSAR